ncbi:MAG: hypothetical protein J5746_00185 [Victivallales bacterium]|nr:hypothetical protein [Victivallales bacterium]
MKKRASEHKNGLRADDSEKRKRIEKNLNIIGFFWVLEAAVVIAVWVYRWISKK